MLKVKYKTQLAAVREAKGLSREEVKEGLNICLRTLQRYEDGIRIPDVLTAIQLADKLKIRDLREIWG